MTALRRSSTNLGVLIFMSGLLLFGCSDNNGKPTQPDDSIYLPNISPENVLRNMATALEHRDFQSYAALLDPRFSFVYAPYDQGLFGMPDSHSLAVELCAARTICTDPRVDTLWIAMAFDPAFPVVADTLPPGATMQINARCCDVGLVGPWPESDAEVMYMNFGDPQTFLFSADTTNGQVRYRLVQHVDGETGIGCDPGSTIARPWITPQSWGWLKYNMYLVSTHNGGPCSP